MLVHVSAVPVSLASARLAAEVKAGCFADYGT